MIKDDSMRTIIRQTVKLPADGDQLFDMYVSADLHSAFAGSPVTIDAETGSPFSAFEGALSGTMLVAVKPTLIVQSWRSVSFYEQDPDSTLILQFSTVGDEGQIDLIHLDVPTQDYDGVTNGWEKYYWTPWRNYLSAQSS
jgi:activator of HSP90 ATPase